MTQTAVQWLKQQYRERGETLPSGVFQEALEMMREQIEKAYNEGYRDGQTDPDTSKDISNYSNAKLYYDQTYNQNK